MANTLLHRGLGALGLALLLSGCSSAGFYQEASAPYYDAQPEAEPTARAMAMDSESFGVAEEPTPASKSGDEPAESGRKRIFNGYLELEVVDLEPTKGTIREYVAEVGGYVEQSLQNRMTLRIPAERFQEAFDWLSGQGTVLTDEISSYDVTDYFRDMETRLNLALRTRARLYELLEETDDVDERVEILREIRRLSEEITRLEANLESLEGAIAFSRIDIDLYQRLQSNFDQRQTIPFPWMRDLRPGLQSLDGSSSDLGLVPGERFAILSSGTEPLFAESPQGTRLRAASVANDPKGDIEFWASALEYHLAPLFNQAEPLELGYNLRGMRFVSFDLQPYYYELYLRVQGDKLWVIEAYYPSEAQLTSDGPSVQEALEGVLP